MTLISFFEAKQSIGKNITYLFIIQFIRLLLPFVLLRVLIKVLTSEQFSVYIYTMACATWLSTFVEYGFNTSATRRIASCDNLEARKEIIIQTQIAKVLLSTITLVFLAWSTLGMSVFSPYPEWALTAWLIGVLIGITPTYYFQATSQLSLPALLEVGGGLITIAGVFLLIDDSSDFPLLTILLILVRLVIWKVLEKKMYVENEVRTLRFYQINKGILALKDGWNIFIIQAGSSIYTTFNVVLLGGVSTASAVATYGSSERMIRVSLVFINQVSMAIFPWFNKLKHTDPIKLFKMRRVSILYFATGGLFIIPLIWGLSPLISDILFLGNIPDLSLNLRVMAFVVPAIAINNALTLQFFTVDLNEHLVIKIILTAAPISIILGYFLSKNYGALGMATTWVGIEWAIVAMLGFLIHYQHKYRTLNS